MSTQPVSPQQPARAPAPQPTATSLYYRLVGTGPVPVVFLHGLFGQGRNFTSVAKQLGDLATCYLMDLPNHGHSPRTGTFGYDVMTRPVVATLRELGLDQRGVVLIGHSMGGKVAMRLALGHPELVRRLAVVDISPVNTGIGEHFEDYVRAMRGLNLARLTSRAEADQHLALLVPDPTIRAFLMQNLHRDGASWSWRINLDVLGDSLAKVGDWPPVLQHYDGPVLWISGADSSYIRPGYHEKMREMFPRARLVRIKGAGHWVHSDQPEAFVSTLRAFINPASRAFLDTR